MSHQQFAVKHEVVTVLKLRCGIAVLRENKVLRLRSGCFPEACAPCSSCFSFGGQHVCVSGAAGPELFDFRASCTLKYYRGPEKPLTHMVLSVDIYLMINAN